MHKLKIGQIVIPSEKYRHVYGAKSLGVIKAVEDCGDILIKGDGLNYWWSMREFRDFWIPRTVKIYMKLCSNS